MKFMVLEEVKQYIIDNMVDEDTTSISIIGSWGKGVGKDPFDIDVLVVKKFQLTEMYNQTIEETNFHLDVWIYDHDSLQESLEQPIIDINQINRISLTILGLSSADVIYMKDDTIKQKIEKAKNWNWDHNLKDLLKFELSSNGDGWIKNAISEDLRYLNAAITRLGEGKPVTHRKKDYPEIMEQGDEIRATKLMELTLMAYNSMNVDIKWTELRDAQRSLDLGDWNNCLASLKDILRFLLRYDLPSTPQQLMDPNLWLSVTEMQISTNLRTALEFAFT